ncbi:MAG: hypothetical protein KGH83_02455 [Thaumarchaeota archaeon]|nr:hypothetical protein [Nitrososphaerota archaeon]
MVFGFGKKKTVENPVIPVQHQREVALQEISAIIKELEGPRISNILQEAKRLKTEIELNRKDIHGIILHLESDDLKLDDVDKNLKTVGKRGKDAVVTTIKKETSSRLTNIERYDDVVAVNNEVNQTLKRIGDVLGLHTRVMHVFARKYADKLKEEIAKLAQNRNALQMLINGQENFKSDSESILDLIKKMDELKIKERQKNHRLTEIRHEKSETLQTITRLEIEIAGLKAKPEHREFLEMRKKIDLSSQEKQEIKGKIDAQFTKISRPLSKYSYVSSFDKPMKKLMEELISDPYKVISAHNKEPVIEILQATAKSVVAGNVSVKDSDKSIELIEETIDRLDEFLKLKTSFAKKISDLEASLNVFDIKILEGKEKELEKARSNIVDLGASSEKIEKEIKENESEHNAIKLEIEAKMTRLNNGKVVIKT